VPQPLAQAKNGDRQFWKQKFHAPNETAQHALTRGPVFFFVGRNPAYQLRIKPSPFSPTY
jgi:hypothetical protein